MVYRHKIPTHVPKAYAVVIPQLPRRRKPQLVTFFTRLEYEEISSCQGVLAQNTAKKVAFSPSHPDPRHGPDGHDKTLPHSALAESAGLALEVRTTYPSDHNGKQPVGRPFVSESERS